MKKLLAIVLLLTALPARSIDKETVVVGTLITGITACVTYNTYKAFHPTVEDLKQRIKNKKAQEEAHIAFLESIKKEIKYEENLLKWKEACIKANTILPKEPFFQNQQ